MPTNVDRFNKNLSQLAKRLPEEALVRFHRQLTLELFTRIVLKTPVDTGRARGGWQVTVGAPAGSSPAEVRQINTVMAEGQRQIELIRPFEVSWITNNVHYIIYLEGGSSKQAPTGMVAVSIAELQNGLFGR